MLAQVHDRCSCVAAKPNIILITITPLVQQCLPRCNEKISSVVDFFFLFLGREVKHDSDVACHHSVMSVFSWKQSGLLVRLTLGFVGQHFLPQSNTELRNHQYSDTTSGNESAITEAHFHFSCSDGKDYIELVMKADNSSVPTPSKNPSKRPRVRCDKDTVAQKVCAVCFIEVS